MSEEQAQSNPDNKITMDDLMEMFGGSIPMEAVNLLFNGDGNKTIGEVRAEILKMAEAHKKKSGPATGRSVIEALSGYTEEQKNYPIFIAIRAEGNTLLRPFKTISVVKLTNNEGNETDALLLMGE